MNGKVLLALLPCILFGQIKEGVGFLENEVTDMAIHGSRLVISSPSGISWVDDLRASPLQWKSITGIAPFNSKDQFYFDDLLMNDTSLVMSVKPSISGVEWLYRNFSRQTNSIGSFVPNGLDGGKSEFHGYNGVEKSGKFYLPIYDGGVLIIESGKASALLIPDSGKALPLDFKFTASLADSVKPIALAVDDSSLHVLTSSIIWKYKFSDSTWSHRKLPANRAYNGITSTITGIIISGRDTISDESVHCLDDSLYTPLFYGNIGAIRYGKSLLYTLNSNNLIEPRTATTGKILESINNFSSRIENATGFGGAYKIQDCGYSIVEDDTLFAVATTSGILYSVDEHSDEIEKKPFFYVRRDRQLKSGLSEIYAVPFIIKENSPAIFEYSLGEDAMVSIDILDYNLDFVCLIVDNESRQGGTKTSSGQSTVRGKDFWDGSRSGRGGTTVAPGVYYYRITTNRGERGFGKVIVAKN